MDQSDSGSSANRASSTASAGSGSAHTAGDKPDGKERNTEDMGGKARREAADAVENQKHTAADQARGFADALRGTAAQLDRQQQSFLAGCASSCAANVDRMASALRDNDFGTLMDHTRDLARRQPGVFFGGAVAAGFLLSRFLTTSQAPGHPASAGSRTGHGDGHAHSSPHAATSTASGVASHGK